MGEISIRLNKFLSEAGYCSRREADKLIEQGRVTINKKLPELGARVRAKDEVRVDDQIVHGPKIEGHVYLALNKPPGIVCTTESSEKNNIVDFVNYPRRIFPVGRLDKPSEGLIFLTSDGDIVNKILRAGNKHEKEYEVYVNKPIDSKFINGMADGVPILGKMTRKCYVEKTSPKSFKIILTQGMNRQIRRMCEHFDYEVTRLKRIRIMSIRLDVPQGQWRELTAQEVDLLKSSVSKSSKTQKASKAGNSTKRQKPSSTQKSEQPKKRFGKGSGPKGRGKSSGKGRSSGKKRR